MTPKATIMVVDDDPAACNLLAKILSSDGYEPLIATGGQEALDLLTQHEPDVIISDIKMPAVDGYQVLEAAHRLCPETPVILLTAFGDVSGAMEAIRRGAHDYIPKPYQISEIKSAAARALSQRDHRRAAKRTEPRVAIRKHTALSSIVGRSPAMLEVFKMAARIAPSDVPVLIVGESGTGKELVARAIHTESDRRSGPFVAVNCAGLAEGVLESELFGHEKGAFTGALQTREGLFEQARGGTLFLDEIGTVSPKMQSQLLRVLQEGELRRVGGNTTIDVDIRLLSATNRDLGRGVEDGSFRDDLYYRLNVVAIRLPPLRERPEDIKTLVDHFIAMADRTGEVSLSPETQAILDAYHWPGNVRELENTISRALALCRGGVIIPSDLPPAIGGNAAPPPLVASILSDWPTLEVLTQRYANLVLEEEAGNKSRAAQKLGIDRKTLYRLLASHEQS